MKTEKEKMLAGEVYDCADNELLTRWHKAKQLQQEYNNTLTTDAGKIRSRIPRSLYECNHLTLSCSA
jgi:maltose O-acetyltransferase